MIFAGLPAITIFPSSKDFVTINPAPKIVLLPNKTPGNIIEFIPIQQFSPISTGVGLSYNSRLCIL